MQMDVKLLRSLDDPLREKTIWFGESEMLARLTVGTISRLIKTRGQADIKTEQIHRVLSSLYDFPLEWSSAALAHFPPVVRSFYENIKVEPRAGVTAAKVQQTMSTHKSLTTYLLQGGSAEPEALSFLATQENQSCLFCILWVIAVSRNTVDCFHMPSVRKMLLMIPPSKMATHVIDLVDFILSVEYPANSQALVSLKT